MEVEVDVDVDMVEGDCLDSAKLPLNCDCTEWSNHHQLLAVSSYQLEAGSGSGSGSSTVAAANEEQEAPTPTQPAAGDRLGALYFYRVVTTATATTTTDAASSTSHSYDGTTTTTRLSPVALRVTPPPTAGMPTAATTTVQSLNMSSGVFDIKWDPRGSRLAAALADGSVSIITPSPPPPSSPIASQCAPLALSSKYLPCLDSKENVDEEGQEGAPVVDDSASGSLTNTNMNSRVPPPMAVGVAWHPYDSQKVASSYRDGSIAIWDTERSTHGNENFNSSDPVWAARGANSTTPGPAHSLEAWQCHFLDAHTLVSGGDDCAMLLWDTRRDSSFGPAWRVTKWFNGGVTCFATSSDTVPSHLVAGSYDQSLSLWDVRGPPSNPVSSISLDGGVWRLKWRQMAQSKKQFLAAATMYNGWALVGFDASKLIFTQRAHYSGPHSANALAYGIDWITDSCLSACSFYDNTVSLWNVKRKQLAN